MAENNNNHDKLFFNLALLGAGYYFVVKPILEKIGIEKDPAVLETERKNKQLLEDKVKADVKDFPPTKTEFEWKVIADQIYSDLQYSFLQKNIDDAAYQIARVKNNGDFILLFKYFAKRQDGGLFTLPGVSKLKNLMEYAKDNLPKSKIYAINKNYESKDIKFRF